jgi:hypothetical protein
MKKQPPTIIATVGTARNRRGPARTIVATTGHAGKGDKPRRKRSLAGGDWFVTHGSIERITGHSVEGPEAVKWFRTGVKSYRKSQPGGRRPGLNRQRNIEMAEEFLQRRKTSFLSDTDLKAHVGRRRDLKRSAAITAVDDGLNRLRVKAQRTDPAS